MRARAINGGLWHRATLIRVVRRRFEAGELVFFDAEGRAGLAPNFKFDGLTVGKTRIISFNLGDLACTDISRIVVNKAVTCTVADGSTGDFCISGLATQSRMTSIGFTL